MHGCNATVYIVLKNSSKKWFIWWNSVKWWGDGRKKLASSNNEAFIGKLAFKKKLENQEPLTFLKMSK